jgi:hypothetical protein
MKPSSTSVKKHAATKSHAATEPSVVSSTATATAMTPSPEVSAPARTLATSAAASPPITPPGDMPPAVGAPPTPDDWEPAPGKKRGGKGQRPKGVQISGAVAAAKELAKATTYVEDFGNRAPPAAQVAFVVTNAAKWRATWQGAKKFLAYAAEQRAAWENDALAQMDALKPAFDYATSRDTALAEKYAATSKFLAVNQVIAARAVSTRKANAKGKGAATAAAVTAPAADVPATPVTPEAALAPAPAK